MAPERAGNRLLTELLGLLAVAAATVATWWVWLGWDTEYDIDPVTQSASGPYEVWQVAGCVLCLGVIAVVGALALRPWLVPVAMTVPFTGAWSWSAASTDDSGLWFVGAVLLFAGLSVSSALVSFASRMAWESLRHPA